MGINIVCVQANNNNNNNNNNRNNNNRDNCIFYKVVRESLMTHQNNKRH